MMRGPWPLQMRGSIGARWMGKTKRGVGVFGPPGASPALCFALNRAVYVEGVLPAGRRRCRSACASISNRLAHERFQRREPRREVRALGDGLDAPDQTTLGGRPAPCASAREFRGRGARGFRGIAWAHCKRVWGRSDCARAIRLFSVLWSGSA